MDNLYGSTDDETILEEIINSVPDDDDPIRDMLSVLDKPLKEYELVVYADGASALTEYKRDPDGGKRAYVGRDFLDADQTDLVLMVLKSKGRILRRALTQWPVAKKE